MYINRTFQLMEILFDLGTLVANRFAYTYGAKKQSGFKSNALHEKIWKSEGTSIFNCTDVGL